MRERGDGWSRNGWRLDAVREQGSRHEDVTWIEVAFNQGTAHGFLVEYYPDEDHEKMDMDNMVRFCPGPGCTIEPDSEEEREAKLLGVIVGRLSIN